MSQRRAAAQHELALLDRPAPAGDDRNAGPVGRGAEDDVQPQLVRRSEGELTVEAQHFVRPLQRPDDYASQDAPPGEAGIQKR